MTVVHSFTKRTLAGRFGSSGPIGGASRFYILPIYGQSLSGGFGGKPAITTSPVAPGQARMFSGPQGVRITDYDAGVTLDPVADLPGLTDLLEADETDGTGGNQHGETFASGFAKYWIDKVDEDAQLLMFAEGEDGREIDTYLEKGSVHYANLMAAIARGVELNDTGRTAEVPFILYSQGEQDGDDNNVDYAADLARLAADIAADVRAITGQAYDPVLIVGIAATHTASPATEPSPTIQAKLDLHLNDPRIFLLGPQYMVQHNADELHCPAIGYRILGEYYAWAGNAIIQNGATRPLIPTGFEVDATDLGVIRVFFAGQDAGLVLDDTTIPDPNGFYGFQMTRGIQFLLQEVVVENPTTVKITAAGNWTAAGTRLRYAIENPARAKGGVDWVDARGNLRSNLPSHDSAFTGEDFYKWCIPFEFLTEATI